MSRASLARLCLLALLWGSNFLFINRSLLGLGPWQVVAARLTAASVVLLGIVAARRQPMPRGAALWGHLAMLGVVANLAPFFLFAWGQERITSGLAGVLNGTTPLFTLGFALAALPEERLSTARGLGLGLGFAGVVVIVGPWDANPLTSSVPGQLACLIAAACYAAAFVYTRRFVSGRGYPPLALAAAQLSCAAVTSLALLPVLGWSPVDLRPEVVVSVGVLGALGTGLAYLLYYRLIADAGATSASMVAYLLPLVAVVLGTVVLAEPVTWNLFVGAAVVILGVALAEGRLDRWTPWPPARPPLSAAAGPRAAATPSGRA